MTEAVMLIHSKFHGSSMHAPRKRDAVKMAGLSNVYGKHLTIRRLAKSITTKIYKSKYFAKHSINTIQFFMSISSSLLLRPFEAYSEYVEHNINGKSICVYLQ